MSILSPAHVLSQTPTRRVLRPGSADYETARSVWNAMVDRRPALIVRCGTEADVAAAIRHAREQGLEVGVRCGGHSIAGMAVPEGGLMIDLTPMNAVQVDPVRRRAVVQGGALLGALDAASQPYGLATTAGNVSHTGVGGLTLGGGMGWLARQYGLACDNVLNYRVVTASGEVVRASAEENPELFWGLRGGGGNFGVVTEFEFRLHPVPGDSLVVEHGYRIEDAAPVLRGWRDLQADAPRPATLTASVSGERVSVGFVWVGEPGAAGGLLSQLRSLGRPIAERLEPMPYLRLQRIDDSAGGHAYRRYWKGHYFAELTDAAIEALLLRGTGSGAGEQLPAVSLQGYGGAIADRPNADAAFSHRRTAFEYVASARWSDPDEDESRIAVARCCGRAVQPFAAGAYVNTLTADEGSAGLDRAYPAAKLARLTALKDAFDPDNVFHLNHNIRPSR